MRDESLSLGEAIPLLRERYGRPAPLPTAQPFELVLLENIAYLGSPAKRHEALAQLRSTVGTSPADILAAGRKALEKVTAHGIMASRFAVKLRACARIAVEELGGDVGAAIAGPLDAAKRALRLFPGIGEPGAEKILLFSGRHAILAPESNGLRVLARLGLVREEKSYAKMYSASRVAVKDLPANVRTLQEAHRLLQLHGQVLCKRNEPLCAECPLAGGCPHARARGNAGRSSTKEKTT